MAQIIIILATSSFSIRNMKESYRPPPGVFSNKITSIHNAPSHAASLTSSRSLRAAARCSRSSFAALCAASRVHGLPTGSRVREAVKKTEHRNPFCLLGWYLLPTILFNRHLGVSKFQNAETPFDKKTMMDPNTSENINQQKSTVSMLIIYIKSSASTCSTSSYHVKLLTKKKCRFK